MHVSDKQAFADAIVVLAEIFGKELSPALLGAYFDALSEHPIETVTGALRSFQRRGKFFPKPADIIELIEGSAEDRAAITWGQLWDYWNTGGSTYYSLFCQDPLMAECVRMTFGGWLEAGNCPRPDSDDAIGYQTFHKSWLTNYRALSHQAGTYEPYLKGRHELNGVDDPVVFYLQSHGVPHEISREDLKALQEARRDRVLRGQPRLSAAWRS